MKNQRKTPRKLPQHASSEEALRIGDIIAEIQEREKAKTTALFFSERWPPRGRKKGKIDPATAGKFVHMVKLKKAGMRWREIETVMNSVEKRGQGTYKQLFRDTLPRYVKWWKKIFQSDLSEEDLIKIAIASTKGRTGRPKKSKV